MREANEAERLKKVEQFKKAKAIAHVTANTSVVDETYPLTSPVRAKTNKDLNKSAHDASKSALIQPQGSTNSQTYRD